jgi:hypothetical protein
VTWLLSALFSLVTRMKVDDFKLADFTGGKDGKGGKDMLEEVRIGLGCAAALLDNGTGGIT